MKTIFHSEDFKNCRRWINDVTIKKAAGIRDSPL